MHTFVRLLYKVHEHRSYLDLDIVTYDTGQDPVLNLKISKEESLCNLRLLMELLMRMKKHYNLSPI